MPTKVPCDIPKFEGNLGKDSTNHVHTFQGDVCVERGDFLLTIVSSS